MGKVNPIIKKINLEGFFLFIIFCLLFIYFITQPANYHPDTFSYYRLDIQRYPVYVIFLRTFDFLFKGFFEFAVVGFQLIFAFTSIFIFYKNFSQFLKLNPVLKVIFLGILVFPLFPPLSVANNLCSEGLSYPLYLLLISLLFDFLIKNQQHKIYLILPVFIILALTRGQFIVLIPVLILLYVLKHKLQVFKKGRLKILLLILITPFITNLLDSSYRKIVHGYFVKTPYSFTNAVTLPLYLSSEKDSILFENEDHKTIFLLTYQRIDSLGLLSSKVEGSSKDKYKLFHDNFPKICNQSFHDIGRRYYLNKDAKHFKNTIETEKAAKEMFVVLFLEHTTAWLSLYLTSIFYGFGSVFIFLFILLIAVFSGIKTIKKFEMDYAWVFFSSLLIIGNALIVAIAVHSIIRYSFYNFALWFVLLVLLLKKLKIYESRT